MTADPQQYIREVMSGTRRGLAAAALRAGTGAVEPFYAAAMLMRNKMYDRGLLRVRQLPRPVISVGNLTTGGSGKTPIVQWLANGLRNEGRDVAVLSRGYKGSHSQAADELRMLEQSLNGRGAIPVLFRANPDRFAGGCEILRVRPETDVFVLDDGFQHRRLARDFDLVLVSAVAPFGFEHILPRGMLREPLSALHRAHAVVVTHADQTTEDGLASIEQRVRTYKLEVPIYRARHAQAGFRTGDNPCHDPMRAIAGRAFFSFCGIGSPDAFRRQLAQTPGRSMGHRSFGDHHVYNRNDLESLYGEARAAAADVLVTTEKDWVKIAPFIDPTLRPEIWRVVLRIQFIDDHEAQLMSQIRAVLGGGPRPPGEPRA